MHRITARSYRSWVLVLGMIVIASGAYFAWHHWRALEAERQAKSKPPAAIPATVAAAEKADFPVYLKGLGTVQPFNTVTVKSRVDGEVIRIAFRQGEMVKEGDLSPRSTLAPTRPRSTRPRLKRNRTSRTSPTPGSTWRGSRTWPSRTSPPASNSTPRPPRSSESNADQR